MTQVLCLDNKVEGENGLPKLSSDFHMSAVRCALLLSLSLSPEYLSSIHRIHLKVKGENQLHEVVLCPTYMHTTPFTHTNNKQN